MTSLKCRETSIFTGCFNCSTQVLKVTASDYDSGTNGRVLYMLLLGNDSNNFVINQGEYQQIIEARTNYFFCNTSFCVELIASITFENGHIHYKFFLNVITKSRTPPTG